MGSRVESGGNDGGRRTATNVVLMQPDKYKSGDRVIIRPKSYIVLGGAYRCFGTAYKRNTTPVPCEWRYDETRYNQEDIIDLLSNPKLVGEVSFVMHTGTEASLIVKEVKTDLICTTHNNVELLNEEWQEICEKEKCTKCGGPIDPLTVKTTSVNERNNRIICSKCVIANAMDMHDDIRERLLH